jgi:hypothetical protein
MKLFRSKRVYTRRALGTSASRHVLCAIFVTSAVAGACGQTRPMVDPWQPQLSANRLPHFEKRSSRSILYVNGAPFTALAVEIPWWDLRFGHYEQDLETYDDLYPKARELGVNTLKVPVKWSMVEPEQDKYDSSYVDHAIEVARRNHLHLVLDWFGHYASGDGNIYRNLTGELFAPMYIVRDEQTYPRAVDADGVPHHNAISYDNRAAINRELKAFRYFMVHLQQVDAQHVVVGIQLENEISVFGADRSNSKEFRDHSPRSNELLKQHGFTDALKYSAWDLSENWIKPLTEVARSTYPIPVFLNFVNGSAGSGMVGGSPGEDVATYLTNCPDLNFIGVNAYFCGHWNGTACEATSEASTTELEAVLKNFDVPRNIVAVTETNSGNSPVAPRFAYDALGHYGVPLFAPWALTVSYPEINDPYVTPERELANGASALRDAYASLEMALPQILMYAGTEALKVFQAPTAGERFSTEGTIKGLALKVTGSADGQAIVIHPVGNQMLVIGYGIDVTVSGPGFRWPEMQRLHLARVHWTQSGWATDGDAYYEVDQSHNMLSVSLLYPQAVLITLPPVSAP